MPGLCGNTKIVLEKAKKQFEGICGITLFILGFKMNTRSSETLKLEAFYKMTDFECIAN